MNKKIDNLITITIVSLIIILSFLIVLMQKKEFSENENRYLQNIPLFSIDNIVTGKYTSNFEEFLNDHFPFRDDFVGIKNFTEKLIGKTKINDIYISKDSYLIFDYIYSSKKVDQISKTINSFILKNPNINIETMIVPNTISVYSAKLPINNVKSNQRDDINELYSKLNSKNISLNSLFELKDKYQLYYKTDHHWTTYGAFFAYQEYLKCNQLDMVTLDDYTIVKVNSKFLGTNHSKLNDPSIVPDNIHLFFDSNQYQVYYLDTKKQSNSLYNYEYLQKKDKYSTFLDNNHSLILVDNLSLKNGNDILIIKNSYGNSLVPFLVNNYDKTHIIDLRYFRDNVTDYLVSNNIKNILIVYDLGGIMEDSGILKLR